MNIICLGLTGITTTTKLGVRITRLCSRQLHLLDHAVDSRQHTVHKEHESEKLVGFAEPRANMVYHGYVHPEPRFQHWKHAGEPFVHEEL